MIPIRLVRTAGRPRWHGSSLCSRLTAPPSNRASAALWVAAAVVAAEAVGAVTEALTANPELAALAAEASGCTRCRLAEGRTQVVFGVGSPTADLMFVGEAPGFHEDQQGFPFVGAAGKLLDRLLEGIGLTRGDVYIANVLKCRPPGNRDPMPDEIESCESYLFRQISVDPAEARRHARELRDEAPVGQAVRHHEGAREPSGRPGRRAGGDALPALPPGRRALHARDAANAGGGLRAHSRAARRSRSGRRRAGPEPLELEAEVIPFSLPQRPAVAAQTHSATVLARFSRELEGSFGGRR